ncbi:hypothetical protein JJB11_07550 [Ramlibacter ginsenosidimutans]|uniref:Uncharacterized protein n=1 Tax=Ramlibacter ginsenosidimutans TaxID=502333 RepID=A0A934TSI0_9BURK|nr:hypothetical protein [Ramlibacter ginsenosidimutans]MBK6005947.1 hypothetical protein [Ramlibacter ginsenosidimutans]
MTTYKRGSSWPNEGFVQAAVEAFFRGSGFEIEKHKTIDVVCSHMKTGDQWRVEAKGLTTAVGLDFRTGLGQLVQGMNEQSMHYGLAVPDIPQFRRQVQAVPSWVAEKLRIHWLYVREDGSVNVETAWSDHSRDTDTAQRASGRPMRADHATSDLDVD